MVTSADTGQPYSQLNAVTCVSVSDCWAGGTAGPAQQNPSILPIFPDAVGDQSFIEHWNGSSWTAVPSYTATAPVGGYVGGLTCVNADDCWATGSTTDTETGFPSGGLAQRWNGSSWSVVPTPAMPNGGGILSTVVCLSADQCWAGGAAGNPEPGMGNGFQPAPIVEAWNGTAWSIDPSPNVVAFGFLASVDCVRADACWATGAAVTDIAGSARFVPLLEQMVLPPEGNQGFVAVSADGGAFNFGAFPFRGSMGGTVLAAPVVGVAATPDSAGYWEVAADGGIFNFGDANFYGSMGGHALNQPVVGIAATPDGKGYWEVAADGGIFNFGDANFYGSMGGVPSTSPSWAWPCSRRQGLLGGGGRRRHLRVRERPVPRLDGWCSTRTSGGRHGRHPERQWLLGGCRRRRHLQLRQRTLPRLRPGAGHPSDGASRRHGGHAGRLGLLGDRSRRLDLRLRRRRLPGLAGRDPVGRPGRRRRVLRHPGPRQDRPGVHSSSGPERTATGVPAEPIATSTTSGSGRASLWHDA